MGSDGGGGSRVARIARRRTCDSPAEARRLEEIWREHLDAGDREARFGLSPGGTILGGLEPFLREQRVVCGNRRETLATMEARLRVWAAALGRGSGDASLDTVTRADVVDAMERIGDGSVDGRERSASTMAKYLSHIKRLARWARGAGHIDPSCALGWLDISAPRPAPVQRRAPTLEDLRWLLERWPREDRIVALVLEAMLLTGARPGAIREIRRRDIRYPTPTRPGELRLAPLKGGTLEVCAVAYDSRLHRVLAEIGAHFRRVRGWRPRSSDRICVSPSGARLTGPALCRRAKRVTARLARHPTRAHLRELRPYEWRHGALTDLARRSVGTQMRATYAGHRSEQMQARYMHLTGDDAAPVRAVVEEVLSGGGQ
jgi:integrase